MSKYTTELKNIVESGFDIGLKDYPIFSEEYREKLNTKIINHYYFHEIGFETVSRFKHYLNVTLNEVMPYYNKMYESELLKINPLLSFERKTENQKNVIAETEGKNSVETSKNNEVNTTQASTNTSNLINNTDSSTNDVNNTSNEIEQNTNSNSNKDLNSNTTGNGKDIFSDTPQALLTDTDIETNFYATNATLKDNQNTNKENEVLSSNEGISKLEKTSSENNSTSHVANTGETSTTATASGTDLESETTSLLGDTINSMVTNETNIITENGFEIPLADLIIKYRETFLNVDMMIINELKDLFMMVY